MNKNNPFTTALRLTTGRTSLGAGMPRFWTKKAGVRKFLAEMASAFGCDAKESRRFAAKVNSDDGVALGIKTPRTLLCALDSSLLDIDDRLGTGTKEDGCTTYGDLLLLMARYPVLGVELQLNFYAEDAEDGTYCIDMWLGCVECPLDSLLDPDFLPAWRKFVKGLAGTENSLCQIMLD